MIIESSFSLLPLNTFGVRATAQYYVKATSLDEIRQALSWAEKEALSVIILGGGSNILFCEDIRGLVLHIGLLGISEEKLNSEKSLVTIAAGEDWSQAAWWAAEEGLGGIENLYLIPGTAGAAAVQNIGAYGVELCDCCHHVTALHRPTGEVRHLTVEQCQFGYRESVFKHEPDQWIVLSLTLELDRKSPLKTGYGALKETLSRQGDSSPRYTDVAKAVATIRESKLPSPEVIGSAGSFFKNPVITAERYKSLIQQYPQMPAYEQPNGTYKLSASWLLDNAGWKQKDCTTVACYSLQPLVITNKGNATGQEILDFSRAIQNDIEKHFGIRLEREVVVYP